MTSQSILAVDSSTEFLSLALRTAAGFWRRDMALGAQASSQLLQQLGALLDEAQVSLAQIDLLVCGRGPGAFTGVRVAVAVCQGLAFSHQIPVLPLSGLLSMAEAVRLVQSDPQAPISVWALQDARMGQVYAAHCQWTGQAWEMGAERLVDYLATAELTKKQACIVTGNVRSVLQEAGLPIPPAYFDSSPSASLLLRLAEQGLAAGQLVLSDAAALLPVYVRNKVAQTTAERAAASAGKNLAL